MAKDKKRVNSDYAVSIFYPVIKMPDKCEKLKTVCDGCVTEQPGNAALLAKACDETGKGRYYFICLFMGQRRLPKAQAAEAYEKAKAEPAPDGDVSALTKEILEAFRENKLSQMGFRPNQDGNGYFVNRSAFARHFLIRVTLVLLGEATWVLYNLKGYYEIVTETLIGKLVRNMLNGAVKDVWRSACAKEIIEALKLDARQVSELNPRRDLLNLENGMLNIDTLELLPHSPEYLSTVRIPYAYDPEAVCVRFRQFLEEVTEGDAQKAALLQEIAGYLLTSEVRAEKSFLLYGSGSNGKSVFANVIQVLVGEENVSSISLEKFSQQFGLQPIMGKTVNISSENELTRRLNTENLKAVVSGDKISISVKYQNDIPYVPTLKLVFLMNSLPDTSDVSDGFYRKLLIVPFSHKFTDDEKDVNLFEKHKGEMPGILNWALEGLKRLKANEFRFSQCDAADRAMEEYKEEQNAVPLFVADCVRSEAGNTVSRKAVVDAYMGWIERNGLGDPCRGNYQRFWNAFKAAAKENGIPYSEKKIHGDRFLNDVRIEDAVAPKDGGVDFEE